MAKINVLPKHIAQLIAAGEVVERPASVIKELVENSIDAKASTITVEIQNGGIRYIRITDNGIGIDKQDVPNAFKNHATSKISVANDLDAIFTLGFRGEALASIAAVSKVEMLTKTGDEALGTRFECQAGEEISCEDAGCPNGTTIVIRDLFYNTPARMKFLKRDVSEANAVADVIDKLALSHPEISFRFIREGKQTLLTAGDSKTISAIHSVFSSEFAKDLLEVDYKFNGITVTGFISKPMNCRASRSMQYFYLNNRFIKSQSCTMSMENAYKNMTMVGKFPICVLNIEVSPDTVDINVHPAKTQVRFSDEKRVTTAVYYAVKTALDKLDTPIQVDLSKIQKLTEKPQVQAVQYQMSSANAPIHTPKTSFKSDPKPDFWNNMSANTFSNQLRQSSKTSLDIEPSDDEIDLIQSKPSTFEKVQPQQIEIQEQITEEDDFFVDLISQKADEPVSAVIEEESNVDENREVILQEPEFEQIVPAVIITEETDEPSLRLVGEAFKTFVMFEYGNKLLLIDKHAAHERIIFNRLKEQATDQTPSQMLLIPITMQLSKNEYNTIVENINIFEKAGYGIEDFGDGTIIIRQIPTMLTNDDAQSNVSEIALYLTQNRTVIENEKIDHIYHTSACKAAIKAGNNNSDEELLYLAKQVISDDEVRYCPHGRPVLIELTKYELEKWFGRIQ
ncbi:MAG: DNA mismatch repair endonuclease MutL [Clostridia bacterium]